SRTFRSRSRLRRARTGRILHYRICEPENPRTRRRGDVFRRISLRVGEIEKIADEAILRTFNAAVPTKHTNQATEVMCLKFSRRFACFVGKQIPFLPAP